MSEPTYAWLNARSVYESEALADLSAAELNRMSMSEYRRHRVQAGLEDTPSPYQAVYGSTASTGAQSQPQAQAPQQSGQEGISLDQLRAMSMAEYKELRGEIGIGQSASNRGLFG
jgi:hypothetical protein